MKAPPAAVVFAVVVSACSHTAPPPKAPAPVHPCDLRDVAQCESACNGGDASACVHLAMELMDGESGTPDPARAVALFERACHAGDLFACNRLGFAYAEGHGTVRHLARARASFDAACTPEFGYGCQQLGVMYAHGVGVDKDEARARDYFHRACHARAPLGCCSLADELRKPPAPDVANARGFYEAAQRMEGACGLRGLGEMEAAGEGGAANHERAAELFTRACEKNESECDALAAAYELGSGVARDPKRAADLHERACEAGNAEACSRVDTPAGREREITLRRRNCAIGFTAQCDRLRALGVPL